MSDTDAEARAYRLRLERRRRAEAARARALHGSEPAKRALVARWDWLLRPPPPAPEFPDSDQPLA